MGYKQDWNGMILHLYRQIDASMFSDSTLRAANGSQNNTYMAFGNFDRLCFTPVKSFVEYLKRSGSAYQWIGGRKDILLYPLRVSGYSDGHFVFRNSVQGEPELHFSGDRQRRFLILSMLYLSDHAKSKVQSYETLLKKCKDQIQRIVNEYNALADNNEEDDIFFEVFGTFNSAEIGILWGADQFTDVQFLVDQIRFISLRWDNTAVPLFTTSYSIVSSYDRSEIVGSVPNLKGSAYIQLATGTVRDPNQVPSQAQITKHLTDLQNTVKAKCPSAHFDIRSCTGEYEYIIETRPPQLDLLVKPSTDNIGALHRKNPNFSKYFSNSTTCLEYRQTDIPEPIRRAPWEDLLSVPMKKAEITNQSASCWKEDRRLCSSKDAYNQYRTLLEKSISSVSSFATNVELLYEDFIRAANATPDRQWAYDLEEQISTAFFALSQFRDPHDNSKLMIDRDYLEKSGYLLQRLRQQILHITEAGKLSFDEPSLHIASTAEYDLLFHMFYGAVKDILACIYDRPSGPTQASQSKLIPIIQFELTPIVKSILYYDIPEIQNRIVDISIPYDAWGEPNVYIAYLVHELYHYVAPFNRNLRNDIFAKFIITEIVVNAFECMVQDKIDTFLYSWPDSSDVQKGSTSEKHKAKQEHVLRSNMENALVIVSTEFRTQLFQFVANKNISSLLIDDARETKEDNPNFLAQLRQINNDNADWHTYEAVLYSWCSGENGFDNERLSNLAGLITAALKLAKPHLDRNFSLLDSTLVQKGFDNCENTLDGCKNFIYSILIYDCLGVQDQTPALDLLQYVQEQVVSWGPNITSHLRELLPDQAMTDLTGLGVSEYLFTFTLSQEKLSNDPTALSEDQGLPIRIGYIVDHLMNQKDQSPVERTKLFSTYRSDFLTLYTSYMRFCVWNDSSVKFSEDSIVKKAHQWFDFFTVILTNYYSQYGCYQDAFVYLSENLYTPLFQSSKKERLCSNTRLFYEALRKMDETALFESNLKAVWAFQRQEFLCELSIHTEPDLTYSTEHYDPHTVSVQSRYNPGHYFSICRPILKPDDLFGTFESILRALSHSHLKAFGTKIKPNGLWYRGSQNASFAILPSAMVHFWDSSQLRSVGPIKGENAYGPLWKFQKTLLDTFKYQADGASEFINGSSFTIPDYISLMQHYEQYTCYLDWSEDAFSSLFFALEAYIMDETPDYPTQSASLYVMDPMLYNRARKKILESYFENQTNFDNLSEYQKWIYKQDEVLTKESYGYIPNLSMGENLTRLSMFTMDYSGGFPVYPEKTHYEISLDPSNVTLEAVPNEVLNLPLAVHTSRLNPRIRTQSGQFMAFSPFTLPVYGPNSDDTDDPQIKEKVRAYRFAYMSLLNIQNYFLKHFPDDDPFVYELQIQAGSKTDVANYLRSTGINRYRIYPELNNLNLL